MAARGPYPWTVKQRVASNLGIFRTRKLADFFLGDYDNSAAFVVLAHLFEQNNHPEIARRERRGFALRGACFTIAWMVARVQSEVLQPIQL